VPGFVEGFFVGGCHLGGLGGAQLALEEVVGALGEKVEGGNVLYAAEEQPDAGQLEPHITDPSVASRRCTLW
jgi:hypothetical protein